MLRHRVLIIGNRRPLAKRLRDRLSAVDCQIETATNADDGVRAVRKHAPQFVVLSDALDGADPLEVSWQITRDAPPGASPVVLIYGAAAGATNGDALTLAGVVDRIAGFLERSPADNGETFTCCDLTIDRSRHRATLVGQRLDLTPTEFKLLWQLTSRSGYPLTREQLTESCLGPGASPSARTIDAHIKSIRHKLGPHCYLLETVHGIGYRFQEPCSE